MYDALTSLQMDLLGDYTCNTVITLCSFLCTYEIHQHHMTAVV